MTASSRLEIADVPASESSVPASARAALMRSLGIRPDTVISEDGDSFATVLCRDEADRPVVLKYVHSRSKEIGRASCRERV